MYRYMWEYVYECVRCLRPPPLKNRSQSRYIQMGWNLEHMLRLEWGGCDKIFSSIPWHLTEIWTKQGSKIGHLISKNSPWPFIIYTIFFVWKLVFRASLPRGPFFKIRPCKRRKRMKSSIIRKNPKKWCFFRKDVLLYDNKRLILKKGPRGRLALETSFQTKKNIGFILYWKRVALEILREKHVLRKTRNKFSEISNFRQKIVFF